MARSDACPLAQELREAYAAEPKRLGVAWLRCGSCAGKARRNGCLCQREGVRPKPKLAPIRRWPGLGSSTEPLSPSANCKSGGLDSIAESGKGGGFKKQDGGLVKSIRRNDLGEKWRVGVEKLVDEGFVRGQRLIVKGAALGLFLGAKLGDGCAGPYKVADKKMLKFNRDVTLLCCVQIRAGRRLGFFDPEGIFRPGDASHWKPRLSGGDQARDQGGVGTAGQDMNDVGSGREWKGRKDAEKVVGAETTGRPLIF